MIGLTLFLCLIKITLAVKCTFCNKDFVSLGHHVCRCKARVTSSASLGNSLPLPSNQNSLSTDAVQGALVLADAPQLDEICTCGRKCKGRRGLKAHQRSCGVFKGLIEGVQLVTVRPNHVSTTPPDEDHIINQQGAHATLPSPIPMPIALTENLV